MKLLARYGRSLAVGAVVVPLLVLFVYVAMRSGPLAPIPVTVASVASQAIVPALFGIGTVEARSTYRIGPTVAGRVKEVRVDVGDLVTAGQMLGEMDPVDLDERISAQQAALKRARANIQVAEAQVQEGTARQTHAKSQESRYDQLLQQRSTSKQLVEDKRQERQIADAGSLATQAGLEAARQELARVQAELDGLVQQRANLHLKAPVAGLVTARAAERGSTVVAGQAVVEMIDPESLWLNVRFDQLSASGLRAGFPASIALRSRADQSLTGQVLRIEPLADAVTEEILAKVVLTPLPQPLPSVGELAEVTVALPQLASMPVVPNAGIHRLDGRLGVWVLGKSGLRFTPVKSGAADLEGRVQIIEGLQGGEQVVLYSQRALTPRSRIKVVDQLPGGGS
jgi:RND family efflux transporter MFP subunit